MSQLQSAISSRGSESLVARRYNQFAFNTLARVSPVSHGVCNVVKRVCIIGSSVMFFGNKLTMQTKLGTVIALIGTYLYTEATKKYGKHGAAPVDEANARHAVLSSIFMRDSFSVSGCGVMIREACAGMRPHCTAACPHCCVLGHRRGMILLCCCYGCRQDGPPAVPRNGEGIGAILCTTIEVCGFDQSADAPTRVAQKSTVWQDRCWFESWSSICSASSASV